MIFPMVIGCGVALALIAAIRQPSPIAMAGLVYAALAICMNFRAIWIHVGNAERITIDLFFTLALLSASMPRESRALVRTMTAFWCTTGLYMCVGTYNSTETLRAVFPWW
jgi:hypothetical protein